MCREGAVSELAARVTGMVCIRRRVCSLAMGRIFLFENPVHGKTVICACGHVVYASHVIYVPCDIFCGMLEAHFISHAKHISLNQTAIMHYELCIVHFPAHIPVK